VQVVDLVEYTGANDVDFEMQPDADLPDFSNIKPMTDKTADELGF
jgi:hypothetical protein